MLITCLLLGPATAVEDNSTDTQSQTTVSEVVIQSKLTELVTDTALKNQAKKKLKQTDSLNAALNKNTFTERYLMISLPINSYW